MAKGAFTIFGIALILLGFVFFAGCANAKTTAVPGGQSVPNASTITPVETQPDSPASVPAAPGNIAAACAGVPAEMKDACLIESAKSGNANACPQVTEGDLRNVCYALSLKDEGFCLLVADEYTQFQCVSDMAKMKNDKLICGGIKAAGWKAACEAGVDNVEV